MHEKSRDGSLSVCIGVLGYLLRQLVEDNLRFNAFPTLNLTQCVINVFLETVALAR